MSEASGDANTTGALRQRSLPEDEIIEEITAQAEDLCEIHDHVTRVVTKIQFDDGWFHGYDQPNRAKFDLDSMVKTVLYMYVMELSQSELERRLRGAAYVYLRMGLHRPVNQQIISHTVRNRFKRDNVLLKEIADRIRDICVERDVLEKRYEPALEPDEINDVHVSDKEIMKSVEDAMDLGLREFTADRADNKKYELEVYQERQAYMNMAKVGATTKRRRFARLSERDEVPHGSSHYRTLLKIADPEPQLELHDYANGCPKPEWLRIRDELQGPFHVGVEKIINRIRDRDDGIREPVSVAIDFTPFPFHVTPFINENDVDEERGDYFSVYKDGRNRTREKWVRGDYPEEVAGLEGGEQGYQFATITIIMESTPVVLGWEPVRDERAWEKGDPFTLTRAEIVDSLLDQASQHVVIKNVFLDRGFDSIDVRHVINSHRVFENSEDEDRRFTYVLGKKIQSAADKKAIEDVKSHAAYDFGLEHGSLHADEGSHDITYVYLPSWGEKEKYAIFTINGHVDFGRASVLINQYRQRMEIENQYKTIKEHFIPRTATKDYRLRLLYFVFGVIMYNVWRIANFLLRDAFDVHLGDNPPIMAGEVVELIGFCLFDPGG